MNNKNLIIIGLIIGISCFFVGAMVSNVFPSSSENLTSYKASSALKLIGIGFITTTLVLSGIIYYDIDKNLKLLLFLIGMILLLIYLIGSPMLRWDISESGNPLNGTSDAYKDRPAATPGFEFVLLIISIFGLLIYKKIKPNI